MLIFYNRKINQELEMKNKFKNGFSLIELAVVLVIVASMAFVFTGGASLLKASKANIYISELTYYENAEKSFRDKYKFLPGDIPRGRVGENTIETDTQKLFSESASILCNDTFANNLIDDLCEEDLYWLQLSESGFIKQNIKFDAENAPDYRDVAVHRPTSDIANNAGWTKFQSDSITGASTPASITYDSILRLGAKANDTDTRLSKGEISSEVAREIDRKIDEANTPYTGKFYVSTNCDYTFGGSTISSPEKLCVLNYAGKIFDGTNGNVLALALICPDSYTLNTLNSMCERAGFSSLCPNGFTANETTGVCEQVAPDFVCPPGFEPVERKCVRSEVTTSCPEDQTMQNNVCVSACPENTTFDPVDGFCKVTVSNTVCATGFQAFGEQCLANCSSGQIRNGEGVCETGTVLCPIGKVKVRIGTSSPAVWECQDACPVGWRVGTGPSANACTLCASGFSSIQVNGVFTCLPFTSGTNPCPSGQVLDLNVCRASCFQGFDSTNGVCSCPAGFIRVRSGNSFICQPIQTSCTAPLNLSNGYCCPEGAVFSTSSYQCATCSSGYRRINTTGGGFICQPVETSCDAGEVLSNGVCCPEGTSYSNNSCRIVCTSAFILQNNQCISRCDPGFVFDNGTCTSTTEQLSCPSGQTLNQAGTACVINSCPSGQTLQNGVCTTVNYSEACPINYVMTPTGCEVVSNPIDCPVGFTLQGLSCVGSNLESIPPSLSTTCFTALTNALQGLGGNTADINSYELLVAGFTLVGYNLSNYVAVTPISGCNQ
jgi:prepilin-type N-terminal cleavage/methylation domain-containing protein